MGQLRNYRSKQDTLFYIKCEPAIWILKKRERWFWGWAYLYQVTVTIFLVLCSGQQNPLCCCKRPSAKPNIIKNRVENKDRCSVHLLEVSNLRCVCELGSLSSPVSGEREAALGAHSSAPTLHCALAQPVSCNAACKTWLPI